MAARLPWFLAGALAVALWLGPAPLYAQVGPPVGMVETQARFPETSAGYGDLEAHLTVETHEAAATAGMFWSQEFKFTGGDGGYTGLQTNGRANFNRGQLARSALFSIFDNRDGVVRGTAPAHPNCEGFVTDGGDGTFVSCIIPFDWQIDREYRLRVEAVGPAPNDRTRWRGTVRDVASGVETLIGEIDVPRSWSGLDAYANAFTEYFGPDVPSCADIPYTFARWRTPTANDGSVTANVGRFPNYPAGYERCVDFARGHSLDGTQIYSETGLGNTERDPIDLTLRFYFRSGLGRLPDVAGLDYWRGVVGDRRDAACADIMKDVGYAFLSGAEFMSRWPDTPSRVDRLYLTLLHRRPDGGGRAYWIDRAAALGSWPSVVAEFLFNLEPAARRLALCSNRDVIGPGPGPAPQPNPTPEPLAGDYRLHSSWDAASSYLARVGVPDGRGGWNPGPETLLFVLDANTERWSSMKWSFEPVGDGFFRIRNHWGGETGYLTRLGRRAGSGWAPANEVRLYALHEDWGSQLWRVESAGDGSYRLTNAWGEANGVLNRRGIQNADGSWSPSREVELLGRQDWGSQVWTLQRLD